MNLFAKLKRNNLISALGVLLCLYAIFLILHLRAEILDSTEIVPYVIETSKGNPELERCLLIGVRKALDEIPGHMTKPAISDLKEQCSAKLNVNNAIISLVNPPPELPDPRIE